MMSTNMNIDVERTCDEFESYRYKLTQNKIKKQNKKESRASDFDVQPTGDSDEASCFWNLYEMSEKQAQRWYDSEWWGEPHIFEDDDSILFLENLAITSDELQGSQVRMVCEEENGFSNEVQRCVFVTEALDDELEQKGYPPVGDLPDGHVYVAVCENGHMVNDLHLDYVVCRERGCGSTNLHRRSRRLFCSKCSRAHKFGVMQCKCGRSYEGQIFTPCVRCKLYRCTCRWDTDFDDLPSDIDEVSVFEEVQDLFHRSLEGVASIGNFVNADLVSAFSSTGVFIYQLIRSRDVTDIAAAAHQYLMYITRIYDVNLYSLAGDLITASIDSVRKYCTESMTETLSSVRKVWQFVLEGPLLKSISNIFISLVSMKWLGKNYLKKYNELLPGKLSPVSFFEAVPLLLEGIASFVDMMSALVSGAPWLDVFVARNPLMEFDIKCRELYMYRDRLYIGLPVEGRMHARDYRKQAKEAIETADTLLKEMSPIDKNRSILLDWKVKMTETKLSADSFCNGGTRKPPLAFVLYGPPGIGKSHLLKFLARSYSFSAGRKYSDELIYSRNVKSDYWEGYVPEAQPYIHYAEVGNMKANLVARTGDPALDELQKLIDGSAYSLNMAFDDKGKMFADPELILIDTNNEDLNAGTLMHAPSAMLRRFLFIEVSVRGQFRKDGSTALDATKSLEEGGTLLDRYDFHVYVCDPKGNNATQQRTLMRGGLYELRSFLHEYVIDHLEEQDAITDDKLYGDVFDDQKICSETEYSEVLVPEPFVDYSQMTWYERIKTVFGNLNSFEDACSIFMHMYHLMLLVWQFVIMTIWPEMMNPYLTNAFYFLFGIGCAVTGLWPYLLMLSLTFFMPKIPKVAEKARLIKKIRYYALMAMPEWNYKTKAALMFTSTLTAVVTTWTMIRIFKRFMAPNTETEFKREDPSNSQLELFEKTCAAEPAFARVKCAQNPLWNTANEVFIKPLWTGSITQLEYVAMANTRFAKVETERGFMSTYIFGLKENYVLMNKHALMECPVAKLHIFKERMAIEGADPQTVSLNISQCFQVGADLIMFQIKYFQFKDLLKHVHEGAKKKLFTGRFNMQDVSIRYKDQPIILTGKHDDITLTEFYTYMAPHRPGLCGLPLVGQTSNNRCSIVGLHTAGVTSTDRAISSILDKQELLDAIEAIKNGEYLLQVNSEGFYGREFYLPGPKSSFSHLYLPNLDYKGNLGGPVLAKQVSKLERTGVDAAPILKELFDFEQTEVYAPPPMQSFVRDGEYYNPWNLALEKMNKNQPEGDPEVMTIVHNRLLEHIISGLTEKGVCKMQPYDMESAINGSDQDAFLRRINPTTSAGFPFKGAKEWLLPEVEENIREPIEVLKKRIVDCIERYNDGETNNFVFTACLKDEPRLVEKTLEGKTRVFYIGPTDLLILCRMFLGPLYTLMVQHSDVFCTAVGIDMHRGAHDLYTSLTSHSSNIMEFDYSGFDVSLPFFVAHGTCTVIYEVLKMLGYNEQALTIVRGLLSDAMFPNINMLEDVFVKAGMQPSGKYGTAEDNSLRGLYMLMYAWYSNPELRHLDFFEKVKPIVYGDDAGAAVADDVAHLFNNVTYQRDCAEYFKMKITPASKNSEMTSFVSPGDFTFLRRSFKYMHNHYVAQLDLNSVIKSLAFTLPSQSVPRLQQLQGNFISMCYEVFFHCETELQYDRFVENISAQLREKHALTDVPVPTYSYLLSEYYDIEASENKEEQAFIFLTANTEGALNHPLPVDLEEEELDSDEEFEVAWGRIQAAHQNIGNWDEFDDRDDNFTFQVNTLDELLRRLVMYEELGAFEDFDFDDDFVTESSFADNSSQDAPDMKIETMLDMTGGPLSCCDVQDADVLISEEKLQAQIGRFLCRPVEIANFQLTIGSHYLDNYDVWDILTKEPSVRAKLRNYLFFRGSIMIEIVFSTTRFHQGQMMISYQPCSTANDNLTYHESNLILDVATRPLFMNYLSQAKHVVYHDLCERGHITMMIPYISPQPYMRLHNGGTTAIAAATSFADAVDLGTLYVASLNVPQCDSATPTNPSVQIYASFCDFELVCPTGTQIEITTESSFSEEKYDERETGPVERVSTRLATYSEWLSFIPPIAPLAKASAMVFKGVAGVASWFGWSRPVLPDNVSYVKNRPYTSACHGIGYVSADRLTYDPKQELTVDPRVCGSDHDEMSLTYLNNVETYLTSFSWSDTDAIGTPIFSMQISPQLGTYYNDGLGNYIYQPTAMCFAATPFLWWRGTIRIRLHIAASAVHGGKLLVVWEPNVTQYSIISASNFFNKQHTMIVDIAESMDLVFDVDFEQHHMWNSNTTLAASTQLYGDDFDPTALAQIVNGLIYVYPQTTLQSPNSTDVSVNVFVSGPEVAYNQLSDSYLPQDRAMLESAFSDEKYDVRVINESNMSHTNASIYHFGEQPLSFRNLLKRYTTTGEKTRVSTNTAYKWKAQRDIFVAPDPLYTGTVSFSSLFGYLPYAYLGMKGSVRRRFHVISDAQSYDTAHATVRLGTTSTGVDTYAEIVAPTYTSMRGSSQHAVDTNAAVEVEFPNYSINMFTFSFNGNYTGNLMNAQTRNYIFEQEAYIAIGDSSYFVEDAAAGEDFSFMHFNGAPMCSF